MLQLFKPYKMRNGDIIILDSISIYDNENGVPMDIFTSQSYDGAWNRKGQYLTNVYFLECKESEMDILKNE